MGETAPAGRPLGHYDFGATPFFACQADQRVSYCLYVPRDAAIDGTAAYDLLAVMHGTGRFASDYRDAFADFAETNRCIVLAPLFPAGLVEPYALSEYKLLRHQDLAFDRLLLSVVDEVAARYRLRTRRFLLYGFSGGGHFAHRFLYLHPERLLGASIGAPGVVTLLDFGRDFWVGVRDFARVFGRPVAVEALRRVPVQMVVGGADTETWEITITPADAWWMAGADLAGATRVERLAALRRSFEAHGIAVRHDVVPGVAHEGMKVLEPVRSFFAEVLRRSRETEEPERP